MMSDFRTDIKTVNELTPELVDFIRRTHDREFGDDLMIYAVPGWYILGYLRGEPVSRVGVLQRTITINQRPLLIAGVSFLVTEPGYRGRGYAIVIMKEAVTFVRNKFGLPFCVKRCKPGLESFYSGMGWRTVDGANVFVQPTGNRSCGGLIMVNEWGEIHWPEGKTDFCGFSW
jgi:GNAT superfamily N-acetyltransferase